MTLRELVWMAEERKRVWGELAAWHLAGLVARLPFTAQALDPSKINPYGRERPQSEKLNALLAWKQEIKMKALAGQV